MTAEVTPTNPTPHKIKPLILGDRFEVNPRVLAFRSLAAGLALSIAGCAFYKRQEIASIFESDSAKLARVQNDIRTSEIDKNFKEISKYPEYDKLPNFYRFFAELRARKEKPYIFFGVPLTPDSLRNRATKALIADRPETASISGRDPYEQAENIARYFLEKHSLFLIIEPDVLDIFVAKAEQGATLKLSGQHSSKLFKVKGNFNFQIYQYQEVQTGEGMQITVGEKFIPTGDNSYILLTAANTPHIGDPLNIPAARAWVKAVWESLPEKNREDLLIQDRALELMENLQLLKTIQLASMKDSIIPVIANIFYACKLDVSADKSLRPGDSNIPKLAKDLFIKTFGTVTPNDTFPNYMLKLASDIGPRVIQLEPPKLPRNSIPSRGGVFENPKAVLTQPATSNGPDTLTINSAIIDGLIMGYYQQLEMQIAKTFGIN